MQISNHHLNLHKYIETVEDNLKKKKKTKKTHLQGKLVCVIIPQ